FIVDGQWIFDPRNNLKEDDGYDSYNSGYFHYNYTFKLNGYTNAKKVFVVGSFNNWKENQLLMHRSGDGWLLSVYLGEGTHSYKFIVDGEWILDPANKVIRSDGQGNFNSVIGLGD